MKTISENQGKLGHYVFSPISSYLAYTAASTVNDHAVSQVYVVSLNGGIVTNLTPDKFKGHVTWVGWKNDEEILYLSEEGVYPKLNLVSVRGEKEQSSWMHPYQALSSMPRNSVMISPGLFLPVQHRRIIRISMPGMGLMISEGSLTSIPSLGIKSLAGRIWFDTMQGTDRKLKHC